jgi:DNA-binding NtrC family response regulator
MSTCIAVIDDDPACRELLRALLGEDGTWSICSPTARRRVWRKPRRGWTRGKR